MALRHSFAIATLVAAMPVLTFGQTTQTESEYYAVPKTAPEFWRAARFEIRTGNYERAAERIKGLLDATKDDNKALVALVDSPAPGTEGGMAQFLRLRNIPRWSGSDAANKQAKANVEELVDRISKAMKAELGNPERIRRYAEALSGPPEESAYALKELRRTGKDVVPGLAMMLSEQLDEKIRAGVLQAIPLLGDETVPGFVGFLQGTKPGVQADVIEALRNRSDFRALALNAHTDPVPTLWYLWGNPGSTDLVRAKAREALMAATLRDPEKESVAQSAANQLTQFAARFFTGNSNLPKLSGDPTEAVHEIWSWDGKALKETRLTRLGASEHYGLQYARWALNIQPDSTAAQKVFLGLAIESHAQRANGGGNLAKTAPELHAALATAPYGLLVEILEDAIREKKTAVALAAVKVLGDRSEPKAARATRVNDGKAERETRPAIFVKALDYPDPRVQFAAADALLRVPGDANHGRNGQIVKILAAALAADPAEGAKQKVLLGDSDGVRAEGVAMILRRVGFDVEVVTSGRKLIRRLQDRADVDLLVVDRHLPDPMLPDLLPQLKSDRRGRTLPMMVIASSEGTTPVNLITAIARLGAVVAKLDLPDNPYFDTGLFKAEALQQVEKSPDEMRRVLVGRHNAQVKRMTDTLEQAGFTMNDQLRDRIAYFSFLAFSPEVMKFYVPRLADEEKILIRRMVAPEVLAELGDAPQSVLRGRIRGDGLPSRFVAEQTVRLMGLTTTLEGNVPVERKEAVKKLWDSFWDPAAPKLPSMEPVRHPEIESKIARVAAPYGNVRVIPAVFTEDGFKAQLVQATDPRAPMMSPAEKKENAKKAMTWLRKMATGELAGYKVADAEPAIRQALRSDDLASMAIDTVVRIPSKEGQQDLANLALAPDRTPAIRSQAASALVQHIQAYGNFVTAAQADAIANAAGATEDAELKSKLLAAQGVLQSDLKSTGDRLRQYVPKTAEPKAAEPKDEPKDKEESKDEPKDKKE